jgi:AcrR family transcriptional regulator
MPLTERDPRVVRSRAAVLEAAAQLLITGGLSALTIDGVVERSGVAKTTVYRHWASRDELVVDTYRHLTPELIEPEIELPFAQRLRSIVQQLVEVLSAPGWAEIYPGLLEAARHSSSIQSLRHRMDERQSEVVDAVLQAGVASGDLVADLDIEEARLQLVGPVILAMLVRPEKLDGAFGDRLVDQFLASTHAATEPTAP